MPETAETTAIESPPDVASLVIGQGPTYRRLTLQDLTLILRYHQDGLTQAQIAQRLNKHQTSISQVLKRLGSDTSDLARHFFKARSYHTARRLTRIAEKGKDGDAVKAGKVVLEAAGVISTTSTVQVGIAVQLGAPALPALQTSSIGVIVDGSVETSASIE